MKQQLPLCSVTIGSGAATIRAIALITVIAALSVLADTPSRATIPMGAFTVGVQTIATGFTSPTTVQFVGNQMFVTDQTGQIRVFQNGTELSQPFLDLSPIIQQLHSSSGPGLNPHYDERGLLGLAFSPNYATNGKFYVRYSAPAQPTTPAGWDHQEILAEFTVSRTNPNVANMSSERVLLTIDHPEANHNAGTIAFGPDGYLYMSMGDGGAANDTGLGHNPVTGNAQDLSTLLGKMLRIDVNHQDPGLQYAIPSDNPFVGVAGARPEIYAYGFRNPYKFSFDMGGNHDLYVGVVGQATVEWVDRVTKGGNYGWKAKEGTNIFDPTLYASLQAQGVNLIDPITEYFHPDGSAIIGGFVYRGSLMPWLDGMYVFGDLSPEPVFQTGVGDAFLMYIDPSKPGVIQPLRLSVGAGDTALHGFYLKGLGQDPNGEIYALVSRELGPSGSTGEVLKLVPEPSSLAALALVMAPWLGLAGLRRRS